MIGNQEAPGGQKVRVPENGPEYTRGGPPLAFSSSAPAVLIRRLWQYRAVRFSAVAVSCTAGQLLALAVLIRLGVSELVANGIGFGLSAQANFVLSTRVTWRDRKPQPDRPARTWLTRWASFNTVAAAALVVSQVVFTAGRQAGLQVLIASLAGIVTGAAFTFALNNLVTFRRQATRKSVSAQQEHRPALTEISGRARQDGVAFFLPAFNEAANLRAIVPGMVDYFRRLDCPFTVIIVDDGSTEDDTYEAAEHLARAYPGAVRAIHHSKNQGYGAALRTGMRVGLGTGHRLIGFCDADGQFDIASFGTLLAALQSHGADLAVGYRIARADSLKRRVMGRAWHRLSSLVLGAKTARDVDCGFKVFTRDVLERVEPHISGGYAAVSPEILSRATSAGFTMTEVGVTHKSRSYGRQTGSDLKVVILSLVCLFQLRLTLRTES